MKVTPVGLRSLAHTLKGLPRIGIEEEVVRGVAEILGQALQSRSLGSPSVLENPGTPVPPSQSVQSSPPACWGPLGSPPLGPSSYSPSHGFTFVLSNRSDRLPASMAVFKVHLWGTQTDCSDKPGHGAVRVPGRPGTLAGVGDKSSSEVLLVRAR